MIHDGFMEVCSKLNVQFAPLDVDLFLPVSLVLRISLNIYIFLPRTSPPTNVYTSVGGLSTSGSPAGLCVLREGR